jgi:amidohydrolase
MIKEGVLEGMDCLVGFHFFSDITLNRVWIGTGPIMATTDQFRVVVEGKGGHGSVPHLTIDPIVCASHLITQLQTIISRKVDPLKSGVVSIGQIQAGEAFNIIPDQAEILGTVRTLNDESRRVIQQEMKRISRGAGSSFGCRIRVEYGSYAPSSINHPGFSEEIRRLSHRILSPSQLAQYHPIMGGEDFAFFSRRVPACYLFIGTGEKSGVHHSGKFNLDEKVLPFATCYLACLLRLLQAS